MAAPPDRLASGATGGVESPPSTRVVGAPSTGATAPNSVGALLGVLDTAAATDEGGPGTGGAGEATGGGGAATGGGATGAGGSAAGAAGVDGGSAFAVSTDRAAAGFGAAISAGGFSERRSGFAGVGRLTGAGLSGAGTSSATMTPSSLGSHSGASRIAPYAATCSISDAPTGTVFNARTRTAVSIRGPRVTEPGYSGHMPRLLASLIVLFLVAGTAAAHSILDRTDPRPGVTLKTPPLQVRLWFTGALEPAYSRAEVLDAAGKRVDQGDGALDPANPTLLRLSLRPLGPGTYRVVWRVLSVDSHVTEGQFSFRVAG